MKAKLCSHHKKKKSSERQRSGHHIPKKKFRKAKPCSHHIPKMRWPHLIPKISMKKSRKKYQNSHFPPGLLKSLLQSWRSPSGWICRELSARGWRANSRSRNGEGTGRTPSCPWVWYEMKKMVTYPLLKSTGNVQTISSFFSFILFFSYLFFLFANLVHIPAIYYYFLFCWSLACTSHLWLS